MRKLTIYEIGAINEVKALRAEIKALNDGEYYATFEWVGDGADCVAVENEMTPEDISKRIATYQSAISTYADLYDIAEYI